MKCRQSVLRQGLIVNAPPGAKLWRGVSRLPSDSGVLLIERIKPGDMRRLRCLAALRKLTIVTEAARTAARVHNLDELTGALLRRPALILISPLYPTRSHPDWKPLPRMHAAALARLAKRRAVALGRMDERRFRRVQRLGFIAWAGISAFRT